MLTVAKIVPKIEQTVIKRWLFFAIALFFVVMAPNRLFSQKGVRIQTVVIDAGHGGKDPGALGKHSREKDIALKVALKLGKYISTNLPDVKVIYTRKTDRFVELYRRAQIANENHADIFISIHCNSNPGSKPYGAETYVMGLHKNNANLQVAKKENASILLEEDAGKKYDNFDINSPESYINLSLFQNNYLNQSLNLAYKIQHQFKTRAGRKDRGVYQAGFLVLWRTAMPGLLVELGYLSNPKEEKFLLSSKGQSYLASAIYRAFKEYKREYEKENGAYDYRKAILKKEQSKNKVVPKQKPVKSIPSTKQNPEYRVQFYSSPKKLSVSNSRFSKVKKVEVYFQNGLYKYTSGHFISLSKAVEFQKKVRSLGYKDAFVVTFFKGKRIK